MAFNDYDNKFDGCEFRICGQGIANIHGNAYIRNCHFESNIDDIWLQGEHCSSVRRCTSVGSNRFLNHHESIAALTIQDCQVDGWKNSDGAISLFGAPAIMMDCVFTNPPGGTAPVKYENLTQRLILSNNKAVGSVGNSLLQNPNPQLGMVYEVPAGTLGGAVKSPGQSFLKSQVRIPGKVFDVKRDFGAKCDGKTDDTAAIRKAIEAARAHGKGAIAYFPSGRYIVTETLEVGGADYYIGGSGFCSALIWKGKPGGTTVHVSDPNGLTLENMSVGFHDYGTNLGNEADIVQTGSDKPSLMFYDHVYVYGMYMKQPMKQGLRFINMGKQDTVLMQHVNGNLRF
ncbi:MAG: glycosyl hydrolase family 28-related protein, partial [Lentisphaerae bacterium]|nr:glycosyl hydrolase family 28-related protein [Lentisphaerota bacterium]